MGRAIVVMMMGMLGPMRQCMAAVIRCQRDRLADRGEAIAGQEHGNERATSQRGIRGSLPSDTLVRIKGLEARPLLAGWVIPLIGTLPTPSRGESGASGVYHSIFTALSRSEFVITLTDDSAIAAAATTGDSSQPNSG